jgi:DNA polymerase-1
MQDYDIVIAHFLLSGGVSAKVEDIFRLYQSDDRTKIRALQEEAFKDYPKLARLYYDVELPLIPILRSMHDTGVMVDRAKLELAKQRLTTKREYLIGKIQQSLGPINVSSPKQLGESLTTYHKITLPKTKTGQFATTSSLLEPFVKQYPIISDILEYRLVDKILNTYATALLEKIQNDGRVHTTYDQVAAPTGRLSSRDPNLQSIPIVGEYGAMIRSCFVAPAGGVLIALDYSQQELRILAHLSQDDALKDAFIRGLDVHKATASRILGIAPEMVDKRARDLGKVLNFGIVYGETAYGLARQLNKTPQECSRILQAYFQTYPGVKTYFDNLLTHAKLHGRIETLLGRQRAIPGKAIGEAAKYLSPEAERVIKNFPIQGSAADMTKCAMLTIWKNVLPNFPDARLILQVHDELIFEFHSQNAKKIEAFTCAVTNAMQNALPLSVPVVVESSVGENWAQLKEG